MYDPRIGRWTSVDPLSRKYSGMSPYNFVGNMPIIAIDPDGRDIKFKVEGSSRNSKGQLIIHHSVDIKIAILDNTNGETGDIDKIAKQVESELISEFTREINDRGIIFKFTAGNISIRSVKYAEDVESDDHLTVVVDDVTGKSAKGTEAAGVANLYGRINYIEEYSFELLLHEFGHNLGLIHVFDKNEKLPDTFEGETNYMDYTTDRNEFSDSQIMQIFQQKGSLNKGKTTKRLKESDYSFSGTTQDKPYSSGNSGDVVPVRIKE